MSTNKEIANLTLKPISLDKETEKKLHATRAIEVKNKNRTVNANDNREIYDYTIGD
ncbi:MAG: hypothetical protein LBG88_03505 [Christensenellaceae bacterium]|jgi:hypothetical protein|nr:hypothetical protein [Christensenellaceae bacterium]